MTISFNYGYACEVESFKLLSPDDRELKSASGTHENGKSNDDVIVFWSKGIVFNFFPQSITNVFKNVQKVYFKSANLSTISKYDLQQFGSQLTDFWCGRNTFEAIDSDFFDFTPNIEWTDLDNNQIKYVGKGALSNLKKLKRLYFAGNPCHSGEALNRADVLNLVESIENNCTDIQALERQSKLNPTTTTTTTTEEPTTTTTTTTEENLIEELRNEIMKLKEEYENKIDELSAENAAQKAELEEQALEIEKKKQENEKNLKIIDTITMMNEGLMQNFVELGSKIKAINKKCVT